MSIVRATVMAHAPDGSLVQPSIHYHLVPPPLGSEPNLSDVADGIWGHWGAAFLATVSDQTHVDSLVVTQQVVPPEVGAAGEHAVNANGTMSISDTDLPAGLVPILNVHTNTRSRSARGYMVMPCPYGVTKLHLGKWSTAFLGTLNTLAALLNDPIEFGSVTPTVGTPVVYSRTRALAGTDPTTFDITNVVANATPHWRRSRMDVP